MSIEPNKKYKVWSDSYALNGGNSLIHWDGLSKEKLKKYFPTWKEFQGQPIKAVKEIEPSLWLVLSLRYNFKFRLNTGCITAADDIRDAFKLRCTCDSRQLFISGCSCGGI